MDNQTGTSITDFVANRISRRATILLNAPISKVFPLFGPIREMEWADGWAPEIIFSNDPQVEEHMIFRTKAGFDSEAHYQWILTCFDREKHLIEYTVSTENRVWFIRVTCSPSEDKTKAEISYTYTALNERGRLLNDIALSKMFSEDLNDWEQAINHYLVTGSKLILS